MKERKGGREGGREEEEKMRGQRNIYHTNGGQRKARAALFILDTLKQRLTNDKDGHYIVSVHLNKGNSPRRKYNNSKCLCNQYRSTKKHETVRNNHKGTNQ